MASSTHRSPDLPLTAKGEQQAKEAAAQLSRTPHDGVYASTMIRTQQTAQPLADELGEQITVLPGLREIEAGDFEGTRPTPAAIAAYFQPFGSGWRAIASPVSRDRSTATSSTPGSTKRSTPFTAAASNIRSRSPTVPRSRRGR